MDDPVFKQKYQKYKLRVKLWEKDFRKKHGRIPSKYDIREASQEIRDSYKMYYKLKTSILEDTLNDVLSDDGFDVFEISQKDVDTDASVTESTEGSQLSIDIVKLVERQENDGDHSQDNCNGFSNIKELRGDFELKFSSKNEERTLKKFEPVKVLPLNEDAWGPNVAMKLEAKEKKAQPKSIKPNFKEKLFKNSSFSIRNPRKSLSKSLLENSCSSQSNSGDVVNTSNKEVLPDLETILLQKAKEQQTSATIALNPLLVVEKSTENIKTQVDEGWLERNTIQNDIKTKDKLATACDKEENNQSSPKSSRKSVFGLTNLDVSKFQTKPKPVGELTQIQQNNLPNTNLGLKFEIENFQPLNLDEVLPQQAKSYESDSVIDESEEETKSPDYRHIVKRRKVLLSVNKLQEKSNVYEAGEPKTDQEGLDNEITNPPDITADCEKEGQEYEQKKNKAKRKNAVAKKPKLKTSKMDLTKISSREKNKTCNERKKVKTNTRASRKKLTNSKESSSKEDVEEKQLDPDDLKYTLALESGSLTSIPRIKETDLDNADSLAKKYINSVAPIKVPASAANLIPATAAEEKRAAAKRRLEEKIASGKLNENFVTINIQKKVFVRGKKSVSYSKYKKKLWKHKKHIAALSGPDMDMGGCDGGTLKCFNCGQAGHFAKDCKIKGDSLLPLTAHLEVDDSPFPTLEEAERIASQTAIAVHSRNISKLPQAPNVALYNPKEHDDKEDEVEVSISNSDIETRSDEENLHKNEAILMETDDELENFDIDSVPSRGKKYISPIKKYIGSKIPDEFLRAAGIDPTNPNSNISTHQRDIGPLYDLNADGSVKDVTTEVKNALRMFGHTDFRKGQDRVIMRILSGMSTLVTLSTGSGKSLCYQLPAFLYSKHKKSITLVISPLVSLMEDQVTGVPHFLRAHCLHTNQTPQQKAKIIKIIADGEIDILLVSPEAVVAGERSTGFGSILRQLPPIAFACIDEAHCVSQWSHNFRPSYLMICKVLRQNLGVKCVLGLTATATLPTRMSIITHLGIADGERGVISDVPLPDNLILSVSKDENRDFALLQLLQSKRFEACQSIIIYCTRRDECERIAGYIRTCLQDCKVPERENSKKKRKRVNWHAEPYHAGMPASRRRTIQNAFMSNELRIVVATVAFGMGINKPDIRAVIHYNMPRNFESYVQEVGRAGRDNKISHCHLFLDANGADQNELKRHIYANSLDRHVIRKLLQHIFVPCSCDKSIKDAPLKFSAIESEKRKNINSDAFEESSQVRPHLCQGHEIGFSIEKTVEALDIPEENISTLLCYMELDNRWCINVLSNAYIKAKVISYGGPKYLKHAAKECPPLAMAIAMEIKNGSFKEDSNIIEFSVIDVAASIGWNSGVVKYQLKNLEWIQVNGFPKRSPITVNFYDLGFRIKAPGDFTAEEIDEALDSLYNRSVKQEHNQLVQLQYIFQGLSSVAYNSYGPCCNETFSPDRSDQLKDIIRGYFRNDYPQNFKLENDLSNVSDAELESDINSLLNMYPENNFSGRNIARIFHGISSPNYPAVMWYRCKFWRVHSKTDFNRIVQLANNVIVRRRT